MSQAERVGSTCDPMSQSKSPWDKMGEVAVQNKIWASREEGFRGEGGASGVGMRRSVHAESGKFCLSMGKNIDKLETENCSNLRTRVRILLYLDSPWDCREGLGQRPCAGEIGR